MGSAEREHDIKTNNWRNSTLGAELWVLHLVVFIFFLDSLECCFAMKLHDVLPLFHLDSNKNQFTVQQQGKALYTFIKCLPADLFAWNLVVIFLWCSWGWFIPAFNPAVLCCRSHWIQTRNTGFITLKAFANYFYIQHIRYISLCSVAISNAMATDLNVNLLLHKRNAIPSCFNRITSSKCQIVQTHQ